jgi:hypothetical protein
MSQENRPRLGAGRYRARAVQWGLVLASSRGKQVAVELELCEPPWQGERITWLGLFDEEPARDGRTSGQGTVAALRACGWQGGDILSLTGLDANEVEIVIDHEMREGRTRARVREITRPSGLGLTAPMTLAEARAFAERMKGASPDRS